MIFFFQVWVYRMCVSIFLQCRSYIWCFFRRNTKQIKIVRCGEVMHYLDVIASWDNVLKGMNMIRKVHSMTIQIHLYNCLVTCDHIFT